MSAEKPNKARFVVIGDYFCNPLKLFRRDVLPVYTVDRLLAGNPGANLVDIVRKLSAENPDAIFVFFAGNSDVQVEIHRRAVFEWTENTSFEYKRFILNSMYTWVKWISELKLPNGIIVCGAQMPTVRPENHAQSVVQYLGFKGDAAATARIHGWFGRHPETNGLEYRSDLVKTWNILLRDMCKRRSLAFTDVNKGLLDSQGRIRKEFVHLNPINHALLWEPLIDTWKGRLDLEESDLSAPRSDQYIKKKKDTSDTRA